MLLVVYIRKIKVNDIMNYEKEFGGHNKEDEEGHVCVCVVVAAENSN